MIKKVFIVARNICSRKVYRAKAKIKRYQWQKLPVDNNKILFDNFGGRGYGCNPKYIAEEIIKQNLGYDLVWLVKDDNAFVPDGIRKVKYGTEEAMRELATAKVIVVNHRFTLKNKKKGQYMIQTWHSSFGIKKVEQEAENILPENYINSAKKSSEQTDLFISGSRLATQRYRDHFWYDGEILECGCPRNDILFEKNADLINKVRENIGITDDSRLLLYAPTFRGGESLKAYSFDCDKMLETLESKGEKWKILIRLHPNAANIPGYEKLFRFGDKIVDTTSYHDFQELMLISDILVTDYSSSIFDFALMGKEILMYTPDLEEYKKERGVRPMFFEIPYEMCTDNEQLNKVAENYTKTGAKEKADRLVDMLQSVDNGTSSAAIIERIKDFVSK